MHKLLKVFQADQIFRGSHVCRGRFSIWRSMQRSYRGIEWSFRAFASMRAVRLFLQARAVINFLIRAASTLEITNGEQRALRKFTPAGISLY